MNNLRLVRLVVACVFKHTCPPTPLCFKWWWGFCLHLEGRLHLQEELSRFGFDYMINLFEDNEI